MAKRSTLTLTDDLSAAAEILRKRRKYRSQNEYMQGLIRYDAQSQREHHLTSEWAALSPAERDLLDAALLKQVQSGEGILGSWLEARIAEIVKRLLTEGRDPATRLVATELAKKIAEGK